MKRVLLVFSLLVFSVYYSQIQIPASSKKGKIVTVTNQTIEYTNLKYENGKVNYYNLKTNTNEFLYDNSIKSIEYADTEGAVNYSSSETTKQPEAKISQKLTNDKDIKNYLLQNNDSLYLSGKKANSTGNLFLAGGAACFITGGIINLSQSKSVSVSEPYSTAESKGSPVPLIIGLGAMGVGGILKVIGHSNMKKAVNNYKSAKILNIQEYEVLADGRGFGVQLKF